MNVTEPDLVRWGERIGRDIEAPVFLALRGPLGAGKSVFARAVARGAGVEGAIPSPTFNLLFRYESARDVDVVHLDLYRIDDPQELRELGWEELGGPDEIVMVEWPERAGDLLPKDRWDVELLIPRGEPDLREVRVTKVGSPPDLPAFPIRLSSGKGT